MRVIFRPMKAVVSLVSASILAAALTGCFDSKTDENKGDDLYSDVSSYKGGKVSSRVADKSIGDMKKNIEFPLKISKDLEVRNISADAGLYGDGTGYVYWKAKLANTSDKEVASTTNICDSKNAAMKVIAGSQYYLVDCESINIRYAPNAVSRGELQFAVTQPWTSINGSMARLCIKDVGCVERYISK